VKTSRSIFIGFVGVLLASSWPALAQDHGNGHGKGHDKHTRRPATMIATTTTGITRRRSAAGTPNTKAISLPGSPRRTSCPPVWKSN